MIRILLSLTLTIILFLFLTGCSSAISASDNTGLKTTQTGLGQLTTNIQTGTSEPSKEELQSFIDRIDEAMQNPTVVTGTILAGEYYYIPFSEEFIINNGNSLDASWFNLTFPEAWLKNPPEKHDNDYILKIADFWIVQNDRDKSPDTVSAKFPRAFFEG